MVDELNRLFGEPVIATKHGGPAGGGAELTLLGNRLIEQYRAIEAKAHAAVEPELEDLDARRKPGR